MPVTENVDQPDSAAPVPLAAPPLQSPLDMIANGATCTLDGTCTPG